MMIKLTDHEGDPVLFKAEGIFRVTRFPMSVEGKFAIRPKSIIVDPMGTFAVLETVEEIDDLIRFGRTEEPA